MCDWVLNELDNTIVDFCFHLAALCVSTDTDDVPADKLSIIFLPFLIVLYPAVACLQLSSIMEDKNSLTDILGRRCNNTATNSPA